MTIIPNSIEGRNIAYQMHPNVNLRKYEKTGGLVIESGRVSMSSIAVAKAQMKKLPYYHTFAYKTHGPSIELGWGPDQTIADIG